MKKVFQSFYHAGKRCSLALAVQLLVVFGVLLAVLHSTGTFSFARSDLLLLGFAALMFGLILSLCLYNNLFYGYFFSFAMFCYGVYEALVVPETVAAGAEKPSFLLMVILLHTGMGICCGAIAEMFRQIRRKRKAAKEQS